MNIILPFSFCLHPFSHASGSNSSYVFNITTYEKQHAVFLFSLFPTYVFLFTPTLLP